MLLLEGLNEDFKNNLQKFSWNYHLVLSSSFFFFFIYFQRTTIPYRVFIYMYFKTFFAFLKNQTIQDGRRSMFKVVSEGKTAFNRKYNRFTYLGLLWRMRETCISQMNTIFELCLKVTEGQ